MRVDKVSYRSFRNIENAVIEFDDKVNVLLGNNAEGKTNALEGIYLLASGKGFRAVRESEMIRFGDEFFEVELSMTDSRRSQLLSFRGFSKESGKRRECRKNGAGVIKISEMIGTFRAVLFCPEHLSIVKNGPSERRNFLDVAISQIKPAYMSALQRYNKILAGRNALIKRASEGEENRTLIEVYSDQLAREAAFIFKERSWYIRKLDKQVKSFFSELEYFSEKQEDCSLEYKNSIREKGEIKISEAEERYAELMKRDIEREIAAGMTLHGTHRDDIEIMLNRREARIFASQGQQRSIALAIKLGEGEISKEESGEYPVFLFDDVLSELDSERQKFIMSRLGERQVIITACNPLPYTEGARIIRVEKGEYKVF